MHTHPDSDTAFPGEHDFRLFMYDETPIYIVANTEMVCILLKTLPSTLSPNQIAKGLDELPFYGNRRVIDPKPFFEEYGFMLYFWQPHTEDGQIRPIQQGDLKSGLTAYGMLQHHPTLNNDVTLGAKFSWMIADSITALHAPENKGLVDLTL